MNYEKKYERAKRKLIQAGLALTTLYDQKARTHIIYHAIHLEGLVADIIACHFCRTEEKRLFFKALVFGKGELSFSKKIDILDELLQQFYPDIHAATPGLITRLNNIRKVRNDFAHGELLLEEAKLLGNAGKPPEGIYLRTIKNGKVVERFWREDEIEERLKLASDLALLVQFVYVEVDNRVSGGTPNFAPLLEIVKRQSPHLLTGQSKPAKKPTRPQRGRKVNGSQTKVPKAT